MAFSPEPMPENLIDFRAPPPSPIASGRRSSVANDDVLTEFLEHSLRVPDLVLPDKIFPRQKIFETPPVIDFQSLDTAESDSIPRILDSLARIGCFQLVNYGIPSDLTRLVLAMAARIFRVPPEKRVAITRSPERPYGFEEVHGEEESELSEEFVWCRDKKLKLEMEGIWPSGYSNFSEKMEALVSDMENVAEKILQVINENSQRKTINMEGLDHVGSLCYLYRHRSRNIPEDRWASSLGYDVIRMLIRGTDYSHALCLHTCDGSSEFHVYSKKGWISFCPEKDAIVVTVGDQTQALSGDQYKHVLGRPIFNGEQESCISMAYLYSPPSSSSTTGSSTTSSSTIIGSSTILSKSEKGKTISLVQQIIVAIFFTLLYHFLVHFYKTM
ncbi:hypothetical protein JCGZ_24866 [Jatropha curcas]|uniref:Non-haem dioxygenase N-terminal domain-containing protein n=1 Tax=Jatropha curcas TaxID=180498 RepID=A0A067KXK2_JATCU|nr:1-aminocyclopropane-1-carboxylate oxidase [Jatropha curcas]KDP40867.1 hypothetical protein JCGZ_24866 [Jatropha curcas]